MIKTVTITNYLGEKVKIDLFDGEPEHGMIIKSITGLGPPKANINMTDLATVDGAVFNSARAEKRNIVIEMLFTYAPTIEDTRQRTYKYFPIKKPVKLLIETDNRKLETTGYVESNEPDIFSKDESNQISIVCDNPYFYLFEGFYEINTSDVDPLFEFPFSVESRYYDIPLIEFGELRDFSSVKIDYKGEVETGVIITIIPPVDYADDWDYFVVHNYATNETLFLDIYEIAKAINEEEILMGDSIIITSIQGKKSIEMYHNGVYYNILNALDINSDWIRLVNGENVIVAKYGEGAPYWDVWEDNDESSGVAFSVSYKAVYEGV